MPHEVNARSWIEGRGGGPNMKAIVLVGGRGTRLRPLTPRTLKQLVPILNRPLLEYLLRRLQLHGVRDVTLAMTAPDEAIEDAFGDGAHLGLSIERVYEGEPLGSGGAIATCAAGWDEPFLVCNGDLVCDINLGAMVEAHRARAAELSIALYEVDDPSRFGVVALDGDRITRFVEKPPPAEAPSNLINAGVWLFEPHVARELDATRFNRVEDELFPGMADGGRAIVGFRHYGYWADVGTSAAYLQTNIDLLRGDAPALAAEGFPALVATGATVAASAMLGLGVVAGAECRIGAGALVTSSVLWDGVHIGAGARVDRCVLASGARVGAGAVLGGAVLGHGAEVAAGERPPAGIEIDSDAVFRDGTVHPAAGSRGA